ncbi:MAG: TolC family protein [Bdellovibrionaceae bacterium]|nr:TolC family protein [Pseudobdellovibrionaceae bacterium]
MRVNKKAILALLLVLVPSTPVFADNEGLSLEALLKSAVTGNAEIKEKLADVQVAEAQQDQANAAGLPSGQAVVIGAPMPEVRGDVNNSTTNFGKWGPFIQGAIQIIQPLYTFGQLGSYKDAAQHQILAKQELARMKKDEIVYKTKEYYYGYQLAHTLESLVADVVGTLEEAAAEADKGLKKKKSKIKPHDVYHLKTELENLRQLGLEATAAKKTAERAVAWISAKNFEQLPVRKIRPTEFEKKTLDDYMTLARANRPEFKALKEGIQARRSLRDAKQAQSYPVLFLGGTFAGGWSPVADRPNSLYANDYFNRVIGGGGVGLRFDLEFWRHSAEAAEQEAEMMKLKAQEEYAVPGIELEVKRAFWDLEKASEGLEIADKRRKMARKWFISNASGFALGITPAKDLMDSLQGDALAKKNHAETIYALNMALATLSQKVGVEVADLKY